MFVRASRLHAAPGNIDALITQFTGDIAPKLKEIQGNTGAVLLVDRANGVGLALTYWRDRAALDASEAAATGLRTSAADTTGATVEDVQRGEILLMERNGAPQPGSFVRSVQFSADPSKIDAGVAYFRSNVLPAIKAADGLLAVICGADRDTGRAFVSTVWTTAEAREASMSGLAAARQDAVQRFGAGDATVENFESVYVDMSVPATH